MPQNAGDIPLAPIVHMVGLSGNQKVLFGAWGDLINGAPVRDGYQFISMPMQHEGRDIQRTGRALPRSPVVQEHTGRLSKGSCRMFGHIFDRGEGRFEHDGIWGWPASLGLKVGQQGNRHRAAKAFSIKQDVAGLTGLWAF